MSAKGKATKIAAKKKKAAPKKRKMSKKERSFRQRLGIYRYLYKTADLDRFQNDPKYREKIARYMTTIKTLTRHLEQYLTAKELAHREPPKQMNLMGEAQNAVFVAARWEYENVKRFIEDKDIKYVNGIRTDKAIELLQFIRSLNTYGHGSDEKYNVFADLDGLGNANLYLE